MLPILAVAALAFLAGVGPAHADPIITPVLTAAFADTILAGGITIGSSVISFASIASAAITTGAAFGLSMLSAQTPKVNPATYQIKQSQPSLVYGYGFARLGGAKFVYEAPNGGYIDGIVHCAGPVDGFEVWFLNDQGTQIAPNTPYGAGFGGANRVPPWTNHILIESFSGTPDQAASSILQGRLPGTWTAQHQLKGLAYSVFFAAQTTKEQFGKYYPSGAPSISVLMRMAQLYDPRSGVTAWAQNSACAILHYLTAIRGTDSVTGKSVPYGFGFPSARIDIASFAAFADVCDQVMTRKDGTTERRYALGGSFDMGQEARADVLKRLLATCDGELYQSAAGKIAIRGGVWTAANVTISDVHILGYEYEEATGKLSAFNRLKISYSDPNNDYAVTEGDPWDDLTAQTESGEVLIQDFTVQLVQSHSQARRLAKIAMAKANPRHKLTITTDLYGLLALGERIIRVKIAELGLDDTFLVTSFTENGDGATCRIGISSLSADAYAWDPAAEEGAEPAALQGRVQSTTIPDVTGIVTAIETVSTGGGVTQVRIRATVDAPSNAAFTLQGRIRAQGSGDDAWTDMTSDGATSVVSGALNDGTTYEVQLAFGGYAGLQGTWTDSKIVQVSSYAQPPAAPLNVSVTAQGGGVVAVDFTFPNSSNAASVNISRASGADAGQGSAAVVKNQAGSPGQTFEFDNSGVAPGHYRYWLQTLDSAGAGGGTAGPYDVDVT